MNAIALPDVLGGRNNAQVVFDMEAADLIALKRPDVIDMVGDSSFPGKALALGIKQGYFLLVGPLRGLLEFCRPALAAKPCRNSPPARSLKVGAHLGVEFSPVGVSEFGRSLNPGGFAMRARRIFLFSRDSGRANPVLSQTFAPFRSLRVLCAIRKMAFFVFCIPPAVILGVGRIVLPRYFTNSFRVFFCPQDARGAGAFSASRLESVAAALPLREVFAPKNLKAFRASFPVHRSILS